MKSALLFGFAALAALGLGHCDAASAQQAPAAHAHPDQPPGKDDPHVLALYNLMKSAQQQGFDKVDHQAMQTKVRAIAHDFAVKSAEPNAPAEHLKAMEEHVLEVAHTVAMQAMQHPEVLASLDSFYAAMHAAVPTSGAAHPHADAGPHGAVTQTLQPGAGEWKQSPYLHQFYDLTKASFAKGARKVDFNDYQTKSYAIFRAFGFSMGGEKAAEGMLDHLKDIPKQMVGIAKDDPKVLDSYDAFWAALSGPE